MHVLWLKSNYIDPPDSGGKIRTYNLLRQLRKLCKVTYVSLADSETATREIESSDWASRIVTFARREPAKTSRIFYARIMKRMFSAKPYVVQNYLSREIRDYQVRLYAATGNSRQWENATVIVCDFLEMAENVAWSLPCPKILFQHNVESTILRRRFGHESNALKKAYLWFEYQRLRRYERLMCNRFDLVMAVSPYDKDVMRQQLGVTRPMEVIETGVDTEYFAPRLAVNPVPARLLLLGSLHWRPNIDGLTWFVKHIYGRVKQACPLVSLDIVGRRPTAAVELLAAGDSSIHLYGTVPDVRPYIAEADLFIVPLRVGSGTRLRIFEAMAMRCPVVSTRVGAEGLPVENGRDVMLADTETEFAETIVSMLADPMKKQAVATAGYELVTRNYSWQNVSAKLYETCLSVCLARRPRIGR